jgi:hypothetical protein
MPPRPKMVIHPFVSDLGSIKLKTTHLQQSFDMEAKKKKTLTPEEKEAGLLWEVVETLPFRSNGFEYGGTFRISLTSKEQREREESDTDEYFSLLDPQ